MFKETQYKKPVSMWNPSFFILLTAAFFYFLNMMMLAPLFAGYAGKIGASGTVMGISAGISYFAAIFISPFVGPLVDRTNKRALLLISLLFVFLSTFGYLLANNITILMFFRVTHGLAFAVTAIVFSTSVSLFVPDNQFGQAVGFYSMLQALAMSIAPTIAISLESTFDDHYAFAVCAMCAFISLILSFFIPNLSHSLDKPKDRFRLKLRNLFSLRVVPYTLIIIFTSIIYSAVTGFLITFTDAKGTNDGVGLFFTIYAVALILSRLTTMRIIDRISYGTALLVCCPCLIACCLCIQLAQNKWILWIGAAAMAFGHGTMQTMSQVFSMKSESLSARGVANSTHYTGLNFGLSAGPIIAGVIMSAGQLKNMFFIFIALASMPLLLTPIFKSTYFRRSDQLLTEDVK